MNHPKEYGNHLPHLVDLVDQGKLKVRIDQSDENGKPFVGLESVYDAVDVSFELFDIRFNLYQVDKSFTVLLRLNARGVY